MMHVMIAPCARGEEGAQPRISRLKLSNHEHEDEDRLSPAIANVHRSIAVKLPSEGSHPSARHHITHSLGRVVVQLEISNIARPALIITASLARKWIRFSLRCLMQ
jgi:hypothetical protein